MIENHKGTIECLYNIDVKSFYWPWTMGGWQDITGYIFRVFNLKNVPRGFTAFKISDEAIEVSKIAVHPNFRSLGFGTRLNDDLVHTAIGQKKRLLRMMVHENCEYIPWLGRRGWRAVGLERNLYPDGTDGYIFEREVVN